MQNDAGAVVNWYDCQFRSMLIPILIPLMQWRLENEKLTLEQLLKDLEGKLEEQGQTFQAQVILNFNYPWRKKLGHFPHMFLSPDIEESCFRWARRTARFDSFWKRSRKVGSCGGCIIMVEHHSRNVEMKPTLHSFVWVCEFWETQNFLVQGSRSTSSWLRSSSPWRWKFKPIGASWRTRRRGLEGPICCFACSWLHWEL